MAIVSLVIEIECGTDGCNGCEYHQDASEAVTCDAPHRCLLFDEELKEEGECYLRCNDCHRAEKEYDYLDRRGG